eukprot:14084402-Alexandrium_andersonii.AAC.1
MLEKRILAQTRSPELSRGPFCAAVRAGSDSGAEAERLPRLRKSTHLNHALSSEVLQAPKGGTLRTEF